MNDERMSEILATAFEIKLPYTTSDCNEEFLIIGHCPYDHYQVRVLFGDNAISEKRWKYNAFTISWFGFRDLQEYTLEQFKEKLLPLPEILEYDDQSYIGRAILAVNGDWQSLATKSLLLTDDQHPFNTFLA